jgi:purine-binding chemotaxis protein CheW
MTLDSKDETIRKLKERAPKQKDRFLIFKLGDDEYVLQASKIKKITVFSDLTTVPQTPDYVRGTINQAGQVIPIIDTRVLLGMETSDVTDQTCIITVDVVQRDRSCPAGLVVDAVTEVVDISDKDFCELPHLGSAIKNNFALRLSTAGDKVRIFVDVDKLLDWMNFDNLG